MPGHQHLPASKLVTTGPGEEAMPCFLEHTLERAC